jgi:hypothetical protein
MVPVRLGPQDFDEDLLRGLVQGIVGVEGHAREAEDPVLAAQLVGGIPEEHVPVRGEVGIEGDAHEAVVVVRGLGVHGDGPQVDDLLLGPVVHLDLAEALHEEDVDVGDGVAVLDHLHVHAGGFAQGRVGDPSARTALIEELRAREAAFFDGAAVHRGRELGEDGRGGQGRKQGCPEEIHVKATPFSYSNA